MSLRSRVIALCILVLVLITLAFLWGTVSIDDIWQAGWLQDMATRIAENPWLSWLVFGAVVLGVQIAVPQLVLVVVSVILLGLWEGFFVVYVGMLVGSAVGYLLGRWLARHPVRRLSGRKMRQFSRLLARRGIMNMTLINLLPLGPHTIINLAAGSSHLRFRDFLPGTAIGLLPSTLLVSVATHFLLQMGRAPTSGEAAVAVVLLTLLGVGGWLATRWAWQWVSRQ